MGGWRTAPLGELVAMVGGGTPTRSTPAFYGGPFPWVTPKDMKSWEVCKSQVNITQAGLDNSAARLVPANSVLVVVRSGILKHTLPVAVNRLPVAINQDMKALLCGEHLDAGFLARFIKAQSPIILQWVRATTADNFPVDKLKRLVVPLPPLPEQRRIAAVLDRAEALQIKRRAALAQLDTLTQSIFLDMFGDPAANPKGWRLRALEEVAETTSGGTPNRAVAEYFGGDIPWVKSGELHQGVVTATEESLTERGLAESSAKLVPPGTVLVAMYGATVGVIGVLGVRAATNQAICSIQPMDGLNAGYLVHLLRRLSPTLLAKRVGGAQPNLSQELLRKMRVPVPPEEIQRDFAGRISTVEKLKTPYDASLSQLDALFASLQYRAFRGEL